MSTPNRRRRLLVRIGTTLGGLTLPMRICAQSTSKTMRIGVLNPRTPPVRGVADAYTRFFDAMRELGYVEGRNVHVQWESADNELKRLPALAARLVQAKVDLIVTNSTLGVRAAQQATATIPIVALTFSDPVRHNFAHSLARPGGNITGTTIIEEDLLVKRLEIVVEMLPAAKKIAYLANPDTMTATTYSRLEAAAGKSGRVMLLFEARTANELVAAFDAMGRSRADAVLVAADTVFLDHAARIGTLARERRLPSMKSVESVAEHCLATYGPDPVRRAQRAAALADKIFKGASPAELPIELPTHFNLVINLKMARSLGVAIPPAAMLQATKVIE